MCSIEAYYREHTNINYCASSCGDRPLPYNPKKYMLVSLGLTLNFIGSWIKSLK